VLFIIDRKLTMRGGWGKEEQRVVWLYDDGFFSSGVPIPFLSFLNADWPEGAQVKNNTQLLER
jgi:hypothetical protein